MTVLFIVFRQSEVEGTAIVVHTSVPFGLKYLENNVDEVKEMIMEHIKRQIPELKDATPVNIKCQRWRYSQVSPRFVELSILILYQL